MVIETKFSDDLNERLKDDEFAFYYIQDAIEESYKVLTDCIENIAKSREKIIFRQFLAVKIISQDSMSYYNYYYGHGYNNGAGYGNDWGSGYGSGHDNICGDGHGYGYGFGNGDAGY